MTPNRKAEFLNNYSMSMVLLRLIDFYLLHCASLLKGVPQMRPLQIVLDRKAAQVRSAMCDLTLRLRSDAYRDMQRDLNSEELQAFGAVAHELLSIQNLLELEQDLIQYIRSKGEPHVIENL